MIRRFVSALVSVSLCAGASMPARAQQDARSPFGPDFDTYMGRAMKQWDVPGAAIAVIRDGQVYVKGYGVRSIDAPEPVDAQTLFAIGSSSKAFTAAALGLLVDEHKLGWDDRLGDDLPGFEMSDPWVTREITIRDALSHRSGLVGGDALWYASGLSRDEIVHRIRYLPPAYSFRSRFEYNNLMLLAAGQVIPAKTGVSWDAFVHDRIFAPLGMHASSTSIAALDGQRNVARPHEEIDGKLRAVQYRLIDDIGPAGSINSNVEDMSHWVQMLLDGGLYGDRRLLAASTVAQLFTPQTIMPLAPPWTLFAPASSFLDYGLGWLLFDYHGHKAVQHGGNIDGMTAMVALVPDLHFGLVVLTNKGDDFLTTTVLYRVFDQILGLPPHDWSEAFFTQYAALLKAARSAAGPAAASGVRGVRPSLPLQRYAGTYRNQLYGDAVVTGAAAGLRFRMLGYVGRLAHTSHDTFRLIEDDPVRQPASITFDIGPSGDVARVRIGNDPNMVFPRAAPTPAAHAQSHQKVSA